MLIVKVYNNESYKYVTLCKKFASWLMFQIAPDDGLIRSHPLLKEAAIESRNSSFTSFYPSLAKLINSDSSERPKVSCACNCY